MATDSEQTIAPPSQTDADEVAPTDDLAADAAQGNVPAPAVSAPAQLATDAPVDLSIEGADTNYTPDPEDVEPEPRKIAMDAATAVQSYAATKRA